MRFAHYPQHASRKRKIISPNAQQQEWTRCIRAIEENSEQETIYGEKGTVVGKDETTFTVRLSIKGRPTVGYHVKAIKEK